MQNATNSYKSACENSLGFPVLIDKGGEVAAKFGVRFTLTPKLIEIYKALGNDLERINGGQQLGAANSRAICNRPRRDHRLRRSEC